MTKLSATRLSLEQPLLVLATLLTGISAGFFSTYQYSVTRALEQVDDAVYVATFQAINASVRSAEFAIVFFGSLVALVVAVIAYRSSRTARVLLVAATVSYIILFAITFSIHVPLNEALAIVDVNTQAGIGRLEFESRWNEMHLIRTLAGVMAFVFTTLALTFHNKRQSPYTAI